MHAPCNSINEGDHDTNKMPMKANAISLHIPAPEATVRTVPYGGGGGGRAGGERVGKRYIDRCRLASACMFIKLPTISFELCSCVARGVCATHNMYEITWAVIEAIF